MEILDYECQEYKYKELYNRCIEVIHNHNASTNKSFHSEYKKVLFMNEQIKKSINNFLNSNET